MKDLILFVFAMFSYIVFLFSKTDNTNVPDKLKSTFIGSFFSINLLALFLNVYTLPFLYEFFIIVPIGSFLGLAPLLSNLSKERKIITFSLYLSICFFISLLVITIKKFTLNSSEFSEVIVSSVFTGCLSVLSIPPLYIYAFLIVLKKHSDTMNNALKKNAPKLKWVITVIWETKLSIWNLYIFTKIPYHEKTDIHNERDLIFLIKKHLTNNLMIPTDHSNKVIVLDSVSIGILLNESLLKKNKIEYETFIIPYECLIEFLFLNPKKRIKLFKKIKSSIFINNIKILAPFMENLLKKKYEEQYYSLKDVSFISQTEMFEKYKSYKNMNECYKNLNDVKNEILNNIHIAKNNEFMNKINLYKKEIYKNKLLNKNLIKEQNIKIKYTLGNLWNSISIINFIINKISPITLYGKKISNGTKSNRWIKETAIFSSVIYGNSIMSSEKDFCLLMILIARVLQLKIDIIYWNKPKNKIIFLNGKH